MADFNIGELDTLVTLYSCTVTRQESGAKKYVTARHSSVFAKLEPTADESVVNTNLDSVIVARCTIYKVRELTTRWQVDIDGTRYSIESIDPLSRSSHFCTLQIRKIQ